MERYVINKEIKTIKKEKTKPSELQNTVSTRSSMTDSKDEQNRSGLTDTENKLVVTSGGGEGGTNNWVSHRLKDVFYNAGNIADIL